MPDGQSATLEQELGGLLDQERFEPPEDFVSEALVTDLSEHEAAREDPQGWWAEQAKALHWFQEWDTVLDESDPPFYKWFVGGKINASYNCLDRHVENGQGDKVAFHWRGEEGEERDVTYADLLRDVKRFANALKDHGIETGDVVGIYLPMIPEVVVAMLACARIGAPHNVVFGGFSPEAVKERMEFSNAKALVTVDGARRKGKTAAIKQSVDDVMGNLDDLQTIFVVKHTDEDCEMKDGRDVWYHDALDAADDECEAVELDAEHPLYILYSSGSTAKPKGILHTTGGYLTHVAWTHRYVFDLKPDEDVWWCSADVGWVTGHSYIIYAPLMNGVTSVMYEGAPDYPDKDIWWELCERYGVTVFYTAPTAIRACIKWGAKYPEGHDLSKLRLLGTVGEPINPKAWLWYHKVIGGGRCPIVDTWWQTETGGIMITTLPGAQSTKPGSAGTPLPGIDAAVVNDEGEELTDEQGLLVLRRPWPGMLRTLYKDEDRFIDTYFSRYGKDTYLVGDAARKDSDGYFWIVGRVDDVINVSGHRLSTAEVESAIVAHPKVAEAAVVAQADEDTGQAIVAYVTLEGDLEGSDEMVAELRDHVAQRIGKLARPKRVIWSGDLPKTRSGKIMRRLLRDIAEGRELGDVTTLRDPDVMKQLEGKIKERQAVEALVTALRRQRVEERLDVRFVLGLRRTEPQGGPVAQNDVPDDQWGGYSSSPRSATFCLSTSMTSGSRSVVTSPSSRPSAMSRSSRRMILPERVLGRSPDQMMRLGRASLPIR
jgi:acetyl-CoA synthetase